MLRPLVTVAVACVACFSSSNAYGQSSPTLVDQMTDLFVQSIVLARTPAGVGIVAHTPLFANDPSVTATTSLITQISQQIGSQVSIFPLGSSSGGFTYKYDPALGSFSRTTQTFGPAFAERAATAGKGRFSLGMNYRHASYDTLDGKQLENGDIKFDLFHQKLSPPSYVEGDVIQASLRMKLTSDTTVFGVNYGITDRLDVGLAVPVVHVALDLTYNATILDFATHAVSPTTHLFANGSKTQDSNSSGSASGIGDVVVRGKYRFGPENAGLAAGLDLRLPSGDEQNFLGSGSTQTKLYFIGSGVSGKASPHVNVGYTFSSGDIADEFNYVGGAEFGVVPKVTVIVDLVGRTLRNSLRLNDSSTPHEFQQGPSAPIERTTLPTIALTPGNLTTVLATAGAKFNPWRNLLVSAHLLFPLNDAGLRSSVTPVIGIEYSF